MFGLLYDIDGIDFLPSDILIYDPSDDSKFVRTTFILIIFLWLVIGFGYSDINLNSCDPVQAMSVVVNERWVPCHQPLCSYWWSRTYGKAIFHLSVFPFHMITGMLFSQVLRISVFLQ